MLKIWGQVGVAIHSYAMPGLASGRRGHERGGENEADPTEPGEKL
jgi:hypothetical protein